MRKRPNSSDNTITSYSKMVGGGAAAEETVATSIAKAVHSHVTEGRLKISTNAQGANLTVDGAKMKRQKGGWHITGLVGSIHLSSPLRDIRRRRGQ